MSGRIEDQRGGEIDRRRAARGHHDVDYHPDGKSPGRVWLKWGIDAGPHQPGQISSTGEGAIRPPPAKYRAESVWSKIDWGYAGTFANNHRPNPEHPELVEDFDLDDLEGDNACAADEGHNGRFCRRLQYRGTPFG